MCALSVHFLGMKAPKLRPQRFNLTTFLIGFLLMFGMDNPVDVRHNYPNNTYRLPRLNPFFFHGIFREDQLHNKDVYYTSRTKSNHSTDLV